MKERLSECSLLCTASCSIVSYCPRSVCRERVDGVDGVDSSLTAVYRVDS